MDFWDKIGFVSAREQEERYYGEEADNAALPQRVTPRELNGYDHWRADDLRRLGY